MSRRRFYITTPIYYVNDKPHIGHIYTTIAADILARYYRIKGKEVFFLTGTDEHGAKVAESAKKAGKSPREFCDKNSKLFKNTFQNLNLSFDYFVRTTDRRHEKAVAKFMQKLWENGDIYEGTYEGLYCTDCEKFLSDKELIQDKCPDHLKVPEKISEKNYFFKLKKYLPRVKKLIEEDKIKIHPEERKRETQGLFRQGLEDFSVSREKVKWGIPLPFDKKQITYVWVEALQNYISAIGYGDNRKEFEKWWPADAHLMGKDILKFHAIYWPALLLAAGEKLPKELFIHGFFTINGQKMSKTLGNVIDPNTLVKKFGPDATRYLLLSQFPLGQDGDIKEEKFEEKYNADLANGLGNLVSRTLNMIEQYCGGKIPKLVKSPRSLSKVKGLIEKLMFDKALKEIWEAIEWTNQYIDKEKPWKLKNNQSRLEKVISELAAVLCEVASNLSPFVPETSEKIITQISNKKIKKGKPLFPRIN